MAQENTDKKSYIVVSNTDVIGASEVQESKSPLLNLKKVPLLRSRRRPLL